ncbi:MAG: hypothetical protein U0228_09970 [Myxococcaceae bacterium]
MTAICSTHPGVPALGACARCGRFVCDVCTVELQPRLCTTCANTLGDAWGLRGRSFDLLHAFRTGLGLVLAEAPALIVLALLFAGPAAALQLLVPPGDDLKTLSASIRLTNLYDTLVGIIGAQAMLALIIARAEGRKLGLFGALRESVSNWGRAVGTRIRAGLWIFFFALLLLIPALWKGTMLLFTAVAALRTQRDDALRTSESLVEGRFWPVFVFALALFGAFDLPVLVGTTVLGAVLGEVEAVPRFVLEYVPDFVARLGEALNLGVLYAGFVMLHHDANLDLPPMNWVTDPPLRDAPRR